MTKCNFTFTFGRVNPIRRPSKRKKISTNRAAAGGGPKEISDSEVFRRDESLLLAACFTHCPLNVFSHTPSRPVKRLPCSLSDFNSCLRTKTTLPRLYLSRVLTGKSNRSTKRNDTNRHTDDLLPQIILSRINSRLDVRFGSSVRKMQAEMPGSADRSGKTHWRTRGERKASGLSR